MFHWSRECSIRFAGAPQRFAAESRHRPAGRRRSETAPDALTRSDRRGPRFVEIGVPRIVSDDGASRTRWGAAIVREETSYFRVIVRLGKCATVPTSIQSATAPSVRVRDRAGPDIARDLGLDDAVAELEIIDQRERHDRQKHRPKLRTSWFSCT